MDMRPDGWHQNLRCTVSSFFLLRYCIFSCIDQWSIGISNTRIGQTDSDTFARLFPYLFNYLVHDKSSVNGKEFVLSNPHAMDELRQLNSAIVGLGYADESFTIRITGGDRIIDSNGVIRSATDNTIVAGAAPNSRHLVTQGARGIDVQVSGVAAADLSKALAVTNLRLLNVTYGDGHKHLDLPATQWFAPRRKP